MRAGRLGRGWRRKYEERKQHRALSNRSWAAEQHLPGATGGLGMMLCPSMKDLKTALEVFAIFKCALSILVIGKSSGFGRLTNCPGLPGTEEFQGLAGLLMLKPGLLTANQESWSPWPLA